MKFGDYAWTVSSKGISTEILGEGFLIHDAFHSVHINLNIPSWVAPKFTDMVKEVLPNNLTWEQIHGAAELCSTWVPLVDKQILDNELFIKVCEKLKENVDNHVEKL